MPESGYCVFHLRLRRTGRDPGTAVLPTPEDWEAAQAYAAAHALTWWDWHPVFPTRIQAEEYARLAPLETEVVAVAIREEPPAAGEEGWFDSFRSPHWFRLRAEEDPR